VTTVVWKKGILVCDSQSTSFNIRSEGSYKLVIDENMAYVVTGSTAEGLSVIDALIKGEEPSKLKEAEIVAMDLETGDGYVYEYSSVPLPIRDKFYAGGSGGDIALGALAMGATPEEAVRIASKYDVYTGGKVQIVYSKKWKEKKKNYTKDS